jgi:hypothetical protein
MTVVVAPVTRANTKAERKESLRMTAPVSMAYLCRTNRVGM